MSHSTLLYWVYMKRVQEYITTHKHLVAVGTVFLLLAIVIGYAVLQQLSINQVASTPPPKDTELAAKMSKGDKNAPVQMVEFADVLCALCAQAHTKVMPSIENDYIKTGKVRHEVRFVAKISPDSARAAKGAYCAAEQNKFWDYYDTAEKKLWDKFDAGEHALNITTFSQSNIVSFAKPLGLDMPAWNTCTSSDKYQSTLDKNNKDLQALNTYSTPTFLINGKAYGGAPAYEVFKAVIDEALAAKGRQ